MTLSDDTSPTGGADGPPRPPGRPSASRLHGAVVLEGDGAAVVLSGELADAEGDALRRWITEAAASGAADLVVDLAAVTGYDPWQFAVLVVAGEDLRRSGQRIVLRGASPALFSALQGSGVTARLHVERPERDLPLVRGLSALSEGARARAVLDLSLATVVRMAQAVVRNADGASITVPRDGRLSTVAASDDVVLEMDRDQYDTGQGPCLDAATQGQVFHITKLAAESRWPAFVPRASARGIQSILSTPLLAQDRPVGALNIYSRTGGAFAEHEREWAGQFAAQAALVLDASTQNPGQDGLQDQVWSALASREAIAIAQGVVIHRYDVSAQQAYALLREHSRHSGTPLREVCDLVIGSRGREPADLAPRDRAGHG